MSGLEPIPRDLPSSLCDPAAYPGDPSAAAGVQRIQTHISDVFMTADRVYKLRKAVDLGFVRFATRAERNADCLRELELNRRLAADVYLGVAPVIREPSGFRVGAPGEAIAATDREHCVVMRRLPDGRDALSLLARGDLRARHLDAVAERVARFHRDNRLEPQTRGTPEAWWTRCTGPVRANLEALAPAAGRLLPLATLARLRQRIEAFEDAHADRFEARRRAGRGVDGHGDLHLQHVWFERDDSAPLLIDCLEFRDDLRQIDAASDVAFLAMDLIYRRRKRLAARFLRCYAQASDDFELFGIVDYYLSYRAAVRAKVAAIAAESPTLPAAQREAAAGSARRHLALAARSLRTPGRGRVVALCGIVGTGKSAAAEVVADALGDAAVIASDRVRKRLAGLPAGFRTDAPDELYSEANKHRTYESLFERAAAVVASGRAAVLDATFSKRAQRERVLDFARQRGVAALLVETRCPEAEVRMRLARREVSDRDPSDAGPAFLERSAAEFEKPSEWPVRDHLVADTAVRGWRTSLRTALRAAAH